MEKIKTAKEILSHHWDYKIRPNRHLIVAAMEAYAAQQQERHKIELSNYAYQIDSAKRERDKAEQEIVRLKDQNNMLDGDWRSAQQEIKRLRSVVDKLEAQLKEARQYIATQIGSIQYAHAPKEAGMIECAELAAKAVSESEIIKSIDKALESSPIEQPEAQKEEVCQCYIDEGQDYLDAYGVWHCRICKKPIVKPSKT